MSAFYNFIHRSGVCFGNVLTHIQYAKTQHSLSKSNLHYVPRFHIIGCFCPSAVYLHMIIVTGFIGNRPTLDHPGYLQKLIQSHLIVKIPYLYIIQISFSNYRRNSSDFHRSCHNTNKINRLPFLSAPYQRRRKDI